MALDVYVVDGGGHDAASGFPTFAFEDRVHDFIFHGCGVDIYNKYPFLRRMIDFYADARFGTEVLDSLIAEIDDLTPHVSAMNAAVDALHSFREVCVAARDGGKSLFLYCD